MVLKKSNKYNFAEMNKTQSVNWTIQVKKSKHPPPQKKHKQNEKTECKVEVVHCISFYTIMEKFNIHLYDFFRLFKNQVTVHNKWKYQKNISQTNLHKT